MERASVLCPLRFPGAVRPGRAGEAGGLMSEAAVPQSVTIAAVPGQVGLARAFVARVVGESHPDADVAVLLASELVTNSVRHSGSAVPGGLVTVAVAVCGGGVRVEVTGRSGDGAPVLQPGRFRGWRRGGPPGMALADACAARWGHRPGRRIHHDLVRNPGVNCSTLTAPRLRLPWRMYLPWTWVVPRRPWGADARPLRRRSPGRVPGPAAATPQVAWIGPA